MSQRNIEKKQSTASTATSSGLSSEASFGDEDNTSSILVANQEMCKYCFDVVIHELIHKPCGKDFDTEPPQNIPKDVKCPLFVTWDKKVNEGDTDCTEYMLRGCIGTLSPCLFKSSLGEYALISAFQDRRFDPIAVDELRNLRVAVSLLVKYEPCEDCFDWTVGVHGIIIKFAHGSNNYNATYLPEVASEQGWDQYAAVKSLVRKAGYRGEVTKDLFQSISCQRYQSSKHKLTYDNYVTCMGKDPIQEAIEAGTILTKQKKGWRHFLH